jgi:hypothetical protein
MGYPFDFWRVSFWLDGSLRLPLHASDCHGPVTVILSPQQLRRGEPILGMTDSI